MGQRRRWSFEVELGARCRRVSISPASKLRKVVAPTGTAQCGAQGQKTGIRWSERRAGAAAVRR